ncbi:MAG: hypothetical protein V1684_02105 [bacterium]
MALRWIFLIVGLSIVFRGLTSEPGWLNAMAGTGAIAFLVCFSLHYLKEITWSEKLEERGNFIGSLLIGFLVVYLSYTSPVGRFGLIASLILGLYFGLGAIVNEGKASYGYYYEIATIIRPMAIGMTFGWAIYWGLYQGIMTGLLFYGFFAVSNFLVLCWDGCYLIRTKP